MPKVILYFQAATLISKAWRDKLAGIYKFADKAKWQVQMVQSDTTAEEIKCLIDVWNPIGCIVDRSRSCARNPSCIFKDTPVVLIDQDPQTASGRYPNVLHDSWTSATMAAEELLRTQVENFSYVPHRLKVHWNIQRGEALAAAVRKAGKTFVPWGESPFVGHQTRTEQIRRIKERLLTLPYPCGLLCANDQVAQNVAAAAQSAGIKVPEDLTIIGIDNDELLCENAVPPISSVLPDFQRGGYMAAEILDLLINHPGSRPADASYGPLQLVRRKSTQRFAIGDPLVNRALEIISARFCDPEFHTLALAETLHCSRSLIELRFRNALGHTIREEIQNLRFEKALMLLRNPAFAITPIPSLCGYTSEAFFKRLFKKKTGLTMREWRKHFTAKPPIIFSTRRSMLHPPTPV